MRSSHHRRTPVKRPARKQKDYEAMGRKELLKELRELQKEYDEFPAEKPPRKKKNYERMTRRDIMLELLRLEEINREMFEKTMQFLGFSADSDKQEFDMFTLG